MCAKMQNTANGVVTLIMGHIKIYQSIRLWKTGKYITIRGNSKERKFKIQYLYFYLEVDQSLNQMYYCRLWFADQVVFPKITN